MEDINFENNKFISYFRYLFQAILEIECNTKSRLFKKILLNSLLDTLSKTTSYHNKGNREKFVNFISNFSEWKYSENVSISHLKRFLEKLPDPEFSKLREFVYSIYSTWTKGEVIDLDKDPPYKKIKSLWPTKFQQPIENIKIKCFQHKNLFYRYRNSLIRELREPGYPIELENDKEPFYYSLSDIDTKGETWELVYPLGFYIKICNNCINNLEEYLMIEKINPYSQYIYGSYWIEKLNLW